MRSRRHHWLIGAVLLAMSPLADAAQVRIVQHGAAVSSGNGTVTVTLPQSVDPARAVLFFQSRHNSNRPPGSMIRGRLASATTLEFVRVTNESSTMTIHWSVVEFASGVRVQRGSTSQSATTLDVALATPVADRARAFLLWSKTPGAGHSDWGSDDPIGGYLYSNSVARFMSVQANPEHIIEYQVVEYLNAADLFVQAGEATMGAAPTQVSVSLPSAVNPAKSFVLGGFDTRRWWCRWRQTHVARGTHQRHYRALHPSGRG